MQFNKEKVMSTKELLGKVAVVTGGNSGIGYATAQRFKEDGATVIITGRSEEKVKAAAAELGVVGFTADAKDLKAQDSLVEYVKNKYGKVFNILVIINTIDKSKKKKKLGWGALLAHDGKPCTMS